MSVFPNLECKQDKGYLAATYTYGCPLSRTKILAETSLYSLAPYLPARYSRYLGFLKLVLRFCRGAGLGDRRALMKAIIRHALVRERVPVLCSLGLGAQHNHNFPLTPEGERWETYFNLENITAVFQRQDDKAVVSVKPVKVLTLLGLLKEAWPQLFFEQQSGGDWLLDDLPYENNESLILTTSLDIRRGKGLASELLKEHGLTIDIQIPPSQKVKSLAQGAIDSLKAHGNYYVLHIRRGDRLDISSELLDYATQPGAIMDKVKDMFPEGSALYIMTDEWDRTFFDPLKDRYRVYRYFNFPGLTEVVHGKRPNNHLLFAAERWIASQASKECRTFVDDDTIRGNIPTLIDGDRDSLVIPSTVYGRMLATKEN